MQIQNESCAPVLPAEITTAIGIASLVSMPQNWPIASAIMYSAGAVGTAASIIDYLNARAHKNDATNGITIYTTNQTISYGGVGRSNTIVYENTCVSGKPTAARLLGFRGKLQGAFKKVSINQENEGDEDQD